MQVTVDRVGHQFDGYPWLFRKLSIKLRPSRIYALTGPSGSGKSTLLGILAGWVAPTEGSVKRVDVSRVGWVFQSPHGVPRRRVIDHAALPLLAQGMSIEESQAQAIVLLERFGLASRGQNEYRDLSGGEAQRLMLARALAASPDLILVDEPTAQLDSSTARTVSGVISRLADKKTIVVVATHDPATRDACTDQIDLSDFAPSAAGAAR